jgi:anti-sigma factor RsiW
MECDRSAALLPRLIDSALGPFMRMRVTHHVAGCSDCAAKLEELRAMQAAIRTNLPYHRAPPGLAARIGAALPREAPPVFAETRPWFRWPAFGMAGTGLAGALAGVALTVMVLGGQPNDAAQSVIGSHIRSMQADHLTDVLTSDQHTVKPWLSARLDVSPPVRDLKDEGFPLVGGRLDYVDGHQERRWCIGGPNTQSTCLPGHPPASQTKRSTPRLDRASTSSPGDKAASRTTQCRM